MSTFCKITKHFPGRNSIRLNDVLNNTGAVSVTVLDEFATVKVQS